MSPTAYLRVAALNAVRRDLVEGPRLRDAVSHAATDWGFWHLSRFAAQYRALFGESPRHTLSHRNGSTPSSRKLSSEAGKVLIPLQLLSRRSPPRPPARRAPPT
jgi:AraC-like DNA-binding protein